LQGLCGGAPTNTTWLASLTHDFGHHDLPLTIGRDKKKKENPMSIRSSTRTFMWSIPTILLCIALQYHDTGKISVHSVLVTVIIFAVLGVLGDAVDLRVKRRFGTSPRAFAVVTLIWGCVAIGMFALFYKMS
jgi:hypothetical protein